MKKFLINLALLLTSYMFLILTSIYWNSVNFGHFIFNCSIPICISLFILFFPLEINIFYKTLMALIFTVIHEIIMFSIGYWPFDGIDIFFGIVLFSFPFILSMVINSFTSNKVVLLLKLLIILINIPLLLFLIPLAVTANVNLQIAIASIVFLLNIIFPIYLIISSHINSKR